MRLEVQNMMGNLSLARILKHEIQRVIMSVRMRMEMVNQLMVT